MSGFNKFLQPKVNFKNIKLWINLYGDMSHPPCKGNHFVNKKYSRFLYGQFCKK
jgi:hypothetical protein